MVVQGGQPPPGPGGPWKAVNGVELSPNAPEIGTRAYLSVAYVPQGPNGDQCPEGYTMAASSKENPSQTCILSKAVGYTIGPPLTVKPVLNGSAVPEKTRFDVAISQLLAYLTPSTIATLLAAITLLLLLVSNTLHPREVTSQQGGRKQRQSKGKHKARTNRRI